MKRIVFALMLCVGLTAHAQWYTGMSQKTGLALCIHLTDSAAELYSPMQSADPIPASSWSLEGNNLSLECKSIGLKMNLTRRDSIFVGYWKQSFLKEDITFYPTDTLFQLRRPQTPQPPYRFDEETVTADYTDSQGNHVHLEGTLTYPKGGGKYPTLVLVSGSGQQNRDEEIFQHKPFLVLADYLASRGIAVLRYDDREVGASKGSLDNADTRLFAEDAEAMFNALKGNPHVDPARLGIGGHSEGGAIAPMVAARNKEVKFVVMLAGQGCTGLDVMLQQNEAIYRANGLSESLLAVRMACMRELFSMPAGSSQKEYKAVLARHTAGLSKEQVDSVGLGRGTSAAIKQQLDSRWMQTFLTLDPAEYLPKVKCPVLALNGSKDTQVLPLPNQQRIKQLCPKADCRTLPDLNHLFQHCTTGSPDEYILIEETFAPEAMQAIADFILKI
jgi:pimeloyl-ACP methyl ester carboxylesterase